MGAIAGVLSIGSALYGGYQSYKAGKESERAAKEREEAGKINTKIAEKEAEIAKIQIDTARLGVDVAELERHNTAMRNKTVEQRAEYQSQLALTNADIAEAVGDNVRDIGKFHARRQRKAGERTIASQRTALAANGIVVDQGTALNLTVDTATEAELDAMVIEFNAEQEAYQYDVQAYNLRSEATLYAHAADTARVQGEIDDIGALLNIEGARRGVQGAELAHEGAVLAIEGAKYGVRASQHATQAARYQTTANTLSLITQTAQTGYNLWSSFK